MLLDVAVAVKVAVGVEVYVDVGVDVYVGVGTFGVEVLVGVDVGVAVAVAVAVLVGVAVEVGVGVPSHAGPPIILTSQVPSSLQLPTETPTSMLPCGTYPPRVKVKVFISPSVKLYSHLIPVIPVSGSVVNVQLDGLHETSCN